MTSRRRRAWAAGLGLLLAAAVACAPAGSSSGPPERGSVQEREFDRQFGDCLREAGYDTSLDDLAARRRSDPAYDKAIKTCATKVGRTLFAPDESERTVREQIRCLRAAGWDVPEPEPDEQGALTLAGVDANVPKARRAAFDADYTACAERLSPAPPDADDHSEHEH